MRGLAGLLLAFAFDAIAARPIAGAQIVPAQSSHVFSHELRLAERAAKVEVDDGAEQALLEISSKQSVIFSGLFHSVPSDRRVDRLANYLSAKSESKAKAGKFGILVKSDISDFNFEFLAQDYKFYPVRFEGIAGATLEQLEAPGMKLIYNHASVYVPSGDATLLLPVLRDAEMRPVTVTFSSRESKLLWTGNASSGWIHLVVAGTTKGCEIDVSSTPSGATVLFNGREWKYPTHTNSVRDPGRYEVIIRKSGYKEWREAKVLPAGASWKIEATLEKQ
jgi:hypothetical protein